MMSKTARCSNRSLELKPFLNQSWTSFPARTTIEGNNESKHGW